VTSFAGGATNEGRALALILFALGGLGLFGLARGPLHVELDLRTRPRGRRTAWLVLGTLALAVVGGFATHSAFQARYASVVFVPLMLLVALGVATFADRRIRVAVLALAVGCGLAGSLQNIDNNRTQAGSVAAALATLGHEGDVVAFCPDQLGPDTARLLPSTQHYQEITYPRDTGPAFVDWINYSATVKAASPVAFAHRLEAMSAGRHQIWFVWQAGYQGYGTRCETIETTLLADSALAAHETFGPRLLRYYEPMELVQFVPRSP
jgi:mannosyltransferase